MPQRPRPDTTSPVAAADRVCRRRVTDAVAAPCPPRGSPARLGLLLPATAITPRRPSSPPARRLPTPRGPRACRLLRRNKKQYPRSCLQLIVDVVMLLLPLPPRSCFLARASFFVRSGSPAARCSRCAQGRSPVFLLWQREETRSKRQEEAKNEYERSRATKSSRNAPPTTADRATGCAGGHQG